MVINDEILDIVNEKEEEDRTVKNLKKEYPEQIKKLEEALLDYIGENDLEVLDTEISHKWKYLTKKLAYPYEDFYSIGDYQKPVDKLKKEHFFSKLKNNHPSDKQIQRTMDIIKKFINKIGDELTEII